MLNRADFSKGILTLDMLMSNLLVHYLSICCAKYFSQQLAKLRTDIFSNLKQE